MRVVLFKVNHFGDSIVFLPVVQELQRRFPTWEITVVTAEPERPLYAGTLPAERIWTAPSRINFNHSWRRPWQFVHWLRRVRQAAPDACLLSYDQGNAAHLLAWGSGAKIRVGAHMPFVHFRRSITTNISSPTSGKIVDWNWAMARALAAVNGNVEWPDTPPAPNLDELLAPNTKRAGDLVVIHAGARAHIRRWGVERMASVAQELLCSGYRVAWVDRPDTQVQGLNTKVQRVTCDSLSSLASLLANASLFLCNNSGPMHLANALGTPLVVISGPSSYDWDPYWYRERNRVLRMPGLACIACEDSGAGTEHCANTAAPLVCMHHWSVEAVAEICREQLTKAPTWLAAAQ